jgi:hypothetical protein
MITRVYNNDNNNNDDDVINNYTFPVRRPGVHLDHHHIDIQISLNPKHVDVRVNPN